MRALLAVWLAIAPGWAGPAVAEERTDTVGAMLLVASRAMNDRRFNEAVVMVTPHGQKQIPIGVVLNRPLDLTLETYFPDAPGAGEHRLHFGGPMDTSRLLVFMHRGVAPPSGSIGITGKLYFSRNQKILAGLLGTSAERDNLRVYAGLSVWAEGQLEREIERGDWYVLPFDEAAVFAPDAGALWPDLIRRASLIQARDDSRSPVLTDRASLAVALDGS